MAACQRVPQSCSSVTSSAGRNYDDIILSRTRTFQCQLRTMSSKLDRVGFEHWFNHIQATVRFASFDPKIRKILTANHRHGAFLPGSTGTVPQPILYDEAHTKRTRTRVKYPNPNQTRPDGNILQKSILNLSIVMLWVSLAKHSS